MQTSNPIQQDNYVRTANKTGFMTHYLDAMAVAGIDFAKGKTLPVLDIGCAFGNVSIPLLAQGNGVIATDTAAEHLEGLKEAASSEQSARLTLCLGAFPKTPALQPNSISAAISIWVLHFLNGVELEQAATKLFTALEPGGKVFISASSPYVKFLGDFIPLYEQRVKQGDPYPGWMEEVKDYLSQKQVDNLPRSMHFLDPDVLTRVFAGAGFAIDYADFFKRDDVGEAMFLDGRENAGLIARKP